MVRALRMVHFEGYIHRDVKPQNVLVCKTPVDGHFLHKLCDFGLAVSVDQEVPDDGDGTLACKPPEKYWFKSSDTYSLGRLFLTCRSAAVPQIGAFMRSCGPVGHTTTSQTPCVMQSGSCCTCA